MNNNWVKTPKHILRFSALQQLTKDFKSGTFIEFGAGTGDFTKHFLDRGFKGTVYDIDERTINILKKNLISYSNVDIIADLESETLGQYDYLFAFEVLEHIDDDLDALKVWSKYLKGEGTLVISVPAHGRKFSEEDKRVGHIRRYEKSELMELAVNAGFVDIKLINYGFPLGNMTRFIKNILNRFKKNTSVENSNVESSIKSGIERDTFENRFKILFSPILLTPFIFIQKIFFKNDFGDGYILMAQNKK